MSPIREMINTYWKGERRAVNGTTVKAWIAHFLLALPAPRYAMLGVSAAEPAKELSGLEAAHFT